MTEGERWAPIPGRPGYQASDLGRIRSVDRTVTHKNGRTFRLRGRILTAAPLPNGYHHTFTGAGRGGYVHRMVLEAFVGPCPDGMEACHGPGGQPDNRLVNLRWDTKSANAQDMIRLGRKAEQKRKACPVGHALAMPNLVNSHLPNRKCRACNCGRAAIQRLEAKGQRGDFRAIADAYYSQIMKEAA
ncbi:MAG: NUMOD4 motif-containing HNH endonuclease [Actinomycetota bacterium]|nr:NUMOD4 motif-containing HNH endonuclease [Actinomycetota bacterium]